MAVSKSVSENLERIKKNFNQSYVYEKPNYDRYHAFRRYVFKSSVSDAKKDILKGRGMPTTEVNVLEAYVSRLLGEFAKHEPSIEVTPSDGQPIDHATIELIEGHIRHIIYDANKNSFSYEVYKDLLSGGFSVAKLWTEYASPRSFNQVIRIGRVFDPTLCGFDPLARYSHKGDGRYCFETFPKSREDFEREYPGISLDKLKFQRNIEQFSWSYNNRDEDIIIMGDYYEKKKKKVKIVKLANGRTMTEKEYEKFEAYWNESGFIQQIPAVIGKPRKTELETICRYVVIESEIIDYVETDFVLLPLVFFDGSSILIREDSSNTTQQMTRPYVYQAQGVQDLKNFAAQTLGNQLENIVQHKFIVMKEALPQDEEYLAAFENIQQADTIVVNAYSENNPDKPIPNPIREVNIVPAPPEVMGTFQATDATTQMILGSSNAAMGINDDQLSGVAIIEAATQTNAAAMPFVYGYLQGLTCLARGIADLLPKYIATPRTIPIVGLDGSRQYVKINEENQPGFDYDEGAVNVNIEAGVNFQIQKNQALSQIIALSKSSEEFAAFINDVGLKVIVKNLTIYGADELQELVPVWEEKKQKMQQQQQEAQKEMMANDPHLIKAKTEQMKAEADIHFKQVELKQKEIMNDFNTQIKVAETAIAELKVEAEMMRAQAQLQQQDMKLTMEREESQAKIISHAIDASARIADMHHGHMLDRHDSKLKTAELAHVISQANKEVKQSKPKKAKK